MAFGSFESLCTISSLPVCSLVGPLSPLTNPPTPLIPATCSARSIELANTIIFQAATDFAHIVALAMTCIMILHVRSKFTAVGRKEILTFFYIYLSLTIVSLVLDAGVLEARNGGPFPWFVAVQNGLASSLCVCLLVNGFVGFQLYEDGTTLSVWLLRLCSLGMFVISFAVSLFTFKSWTSLSPNNTTGLFVVLYVLNGICIFIYLAMQVFLVLNTLQDRWPLGDLVFGVFFFVVGQVILYVFGDRICEGISHYLDGLFFATVCNLLAVMMVYKYWDSITREDLEFSVGTKQGHWEVKEPLLLDTAEERRASIFDVAGSVPTAPGSGTARNSSYYDTDSQPQTTTNPYGHGQRGARNHSHSRSRGQSRDRDRDRDRSSLGGQNLLVDSPVDMQPQGRNQSHNRQNSGFGLLMDRQQDETSMNMGPSAWRPQQQRERRTRSSQRESNGSGKGNGNRRSRVQVQERTRSYQDA